MTKERFALSLSGSVLQSCLDVPVKRGLRKILPELSAYRLFRRSTIPWDHGHPFAIGDCSRSHEEGVGWQLLGSNLPGFASDQGGPIVRFILHSRLDGGWLDVLLRRAG